MRKRHACRRTRPAVLEKDHYPEKTTRHCRCRSEKQDVTLTIRRLSHLFTESLKSHWRRALSVATKERTPAPWELRRNDCANKRARCTMATLLSASHGLHSDRTFANAMLFPEARIDPEWTSPYKVDRNNEFEIVLARRRILRCQIS
jgi:hypothetical protein